MDVGEHWAYRPNMKRARFDEARVMVIGKKVKIELMADEFEGETRWVSPSRLECPWDEVEEYAGDDALYRQFRDAERPPRYELEAAEQVFIYSLPDDLDWEIRSHPRGALWVQDPGLLASQLATSVAQLFRTDNSYVGHRGSAVNWPTTREIAKQLAPAHAKELFQRIEEEERTATRESLVGKTVQWTRNDEPFDVPGDVIARSFEKHTAPEHEVLRRWSGVKQSAERSELVEIRVEIARVGDIALRAIDRLRRSAPASAASLEQELLTPGAKSDGYALSEEQELLIPFNRPRYRWARMQDDAETDGRATS